jgi:hypothetical protein
MISTSDEALRDTHILAMTVYIPLEGRKKQPCLSNERGGIHYKNTVQKMIIRVECWSNSQPWRPLHHPLPAKECETWYQEILIIRTQTIDVVHRNRTKEKQHVEYICKKIMCLEHHVAIDEKRHRKTISVQTRFYFKCRKDARERYFNLSSFFDVYTMHLAQPRVII